MGCSILPSNGQHAPEMLAVNLGCRYNHTVVADTQDISGNLTLNQLLAFCFSLLLGTWVNLRAMWDSLIRLKYTTAVN